MRPISRLSCGKWPARRAGCRRGRSGGATRNWPRFCPTRLSGSVSQQRLAAAEQEEAFTSVPFVPTGQFVIPTAFRSNLKGVIVAPIVLMWNVEKK